MASFNTFYDSANTSVRAFLTKVGSFYNNGKNFNTSSGEGKKIWILIKDEFRNSCGYCGIGETNLSMEHLIMINRIEYGLHHPGNIIPCCKNCNKRLKENGKHLTWKEHLKGIAGVNYELRLKKIEKHIKKYKYPNFSDAEIKAIKVIAESLYSNIVSEGEKSYGMYINLRKEFL